MEFKKPGNHLIIDTDAGIDDALAILTVCARIGDMLEAVTCTAGNTSLEAVVNNVFLTLEQAEMDTPVYAGSSQPLTGSAPDPGEIMGPDGLGGATAQLPPASRKSLQPGPAALAILECSHRVQPLTILALGPLTNLALAIRLDESLPSRIDQLVIMGGTIHAQGNASPAAEFNFFYDPEAAYSVIHAGFSQVVLVPWETCMAAAITWEQYGRLCSLGTSRAAFFRLITGGLATVLREQYHLPGLVLPDVTAASVALDRDLALETCDVGLDVVIQQGAGRGFTAVDRRGLGKSRLNSRVVLAIDQSKLYDILYTVLAASR